MEKEEEWRDVVGYEGCYMVSSMGRVYSCPNHIHNGMILKADKYQNGYYRVALSRHGKKKYIMIHRLVAQAFIPNPNNYPVVNHKDENKANNFVGNLEWCSIKYNNTYGKVSRKERILNCKLGRAVVQMTLKGEDIAVFSSLNEAGRYVGVSAANIASACTGFVKTSAGFKWRYADDAVPHSKAKLVAQYTLDGEYVKTFQSVRSAAKATGSSMSGISETCEGRRRTSHGFVWRYV